MNLNDVDCADIADTITRKAVINHTCTECAGVIKAGEHYEYTSALYDGSWNHYKTCTDCQALLEKCNALACDEYYGHVSIPFAGLYEFVVESDNPELLRELKTILRKRK